MMWLRRPSFSLIEFLVYSVAGFFLVTILLVQLWSFHAQQSRRAACRDQLMNAFSALDLLRYELSQAPCRKSAWYFIGDSRLIWQIPGGQARGYSLKKEKLIRIEGNYDASRKRWIKKSSSLMLTSIAKVRFWHDMQQDVVKAVGIEITLKGANNRQVFCDWVLLRNQLLG
jgi:hypothetical protein